MTASLSRSEKVALLSPSLILEKHGTQELSRLRATGAPARGLALTGLSTVQLHLCENEDSGKGILLPLAYCLSLLDWSIKSSSISPVLTKIATSMNTRRIPFNAVRECQ